MYVDLTEHLADLERTLGAESKTYKTTCQAFLDHPNLRAFKSPKGVILLCSADINKIADDIEILHERDPHGSLEVLPYVHAQGQRIYADPPMHVVAHKYTKGFGEQPLEGWEELLKGSDLSQAVITKVKWYLAAHCPVNYEDIPDELPKEEQENHER